MPQLKAAGRGLLQRLLIFLAPQMRPVPLFFARMHQQTRLPQYVAIGGEAQRKRRDETVHLS